MKTTELQLDNEESELLIRQVPNEIINGVHVPEFNTRIGIPDERFKELANRLRSECSDATFLGGAEAQALRNALSVVLQELGLYEFQTRTGSSFEAGQNTLAKLDAFLASPAEA